MGCHMTVSNDILYLITLKNLEMHLMLYEYGAVTYVLVWVFELGCNGTGHIKYLS